MQSAPGRKANGRLKIKVEQATCDQCRRNKILPGINLNRELETLAQLPSQPAYTHLSPTISNAQSSPAPSSTPFQHIPTRNDPPVLHSTPELLKQVRQVSRPSGSSQPRDLKNDVYWSATSSTKVEQPRFHGTSSGEILLRDAKEMRRVYVPSAGSGKILRRRPQFWEPPAPERRWRDAEPEPVQLPPADLINSLVELYFRYINTFFPILHRELFEQTLKRGTHLASDTTGRTFARLLLLVCAVASRWSFDPRVLMDGQSQSAGYEFFHRAGPITWAFRTQPSLYDVQICILSALFLQGSSSHFSGWTVLGIGIRLAQDIGAHRKKEGVTIENELYKRAFWSLLVLDRMICGTLGRPSAMQDLDSDLDPIMELDDEDWPINNVPSLPPGKPSRLSYFNGVVGLSRILERAIQTLYALDWAKRQMGLTGPEKEGELLADLQRHLEQWKMTVPPHLHLTAPMGPAGLFLDQAVALWSMYHHVNIIIHREFITKRSTLTADCLNRCRRSARECAKILGAHLRIEGTRPVYNTIHAAFSSGLILTFDILVGEKASRTDQNNPWASAEDDYSRAEKEADIETCKAVLERAESRSSTAGQWRDILREFQQPGTSLIHTEPEPMPKKSSSEIHEPYVGGSGIGPVPGPGDPYPFSFSFDPHYGQTYGSGQASGMVTNFPMTTPTAVPGVFTPSYTTSPDPSSSAYSQGAYLPDAYYGDNTNIPFPGFVSQFNFAPNQGRDDTSEWGQPSTSQWQQFFYDALSQGVMEPQPR